MYNNLEIAKIMDSVGFVGLYNHVFDRQVGLRSYGFPCSQRIAMLTVLKVCQGHQAIRGRTTFWGGG